MNNKVDRAVSLFGASRQGPENLAAAQVTIAREIVGNDALEADAACRKLRAFEHSDQTNFDATDTFGGLLAAQLGVSRERYDLAFATKRCSACSGQLVRPLTCSAFPTASISALR